MDDRNEEFDLRDASFGKGDQFIPDFLLVKKGIFIPEQAVVSTLIPGFSSSL